MLRASGKIDLQKQIDQVSSKLTELQSSRHVLIGQKSWNVFDRKNETLEKELKEIIAEYQRILGYSFKNMASSGT
ncbi:MAG: hypothetical protein FJZ57_02930 [Chlamydiae bacterium]|nr:hypothetical protein [Chlamydiota bacterium]